MEHDEKLKGDDQKSFLFCLKIIFQNHLFVHYKVFGVKTKLKKNATLQTYRRNKW